MTSRLSLDMYLNLIYNNHNLQDGYFWRICPTRVHWLFRVTLSTHNCCAFYFAPYFFNLVRLLSLLIFSLWFGDFVCGHVTLTCQHKAAPLSKTKTWSIHLVCQILTNKGLEWKAWIFVLLFNQQKKTLLWVFFWLENNLKKFIWFQR
jgi:hypothetical protein